jgi:hypothetical protein
MTQGAAEAGACVRASTVLLAITLVTAACGASAPSAIPSRDATSASPQSGDVVPSAGASSVPTPTGRPSPTIEPISATSAPVAGPGPRPAFEAGECLWTVSDDLRVRSQPGVGPDSRRYEPLLPKGTTLCVIDGPVEASGYWWYQVELEPEDLHGGFTTGWVAAGDHDGSAWIDYEPGIDGIDTEPIEDPGEVGGLPVPILDYVAVGVEEGSDGDVLVRYDFSVVNWEDFDGLPWDDASDAGPCGEEAGRFFARIVTTDGVQLNNFCRLSDSYDLTRLWFTGPFQEELPVPIQLQMWDLETGDRTVSNSMLIENPYATFESPTP